MTAALPLRTCGWKVVHAHAHDCLMMNHTSALQAHPHHPLLLLNSTPGIQLRPPVPASPLVRVLGM